MMVSSLHKINNLYIGFRHQRLSAEIFPDGDFMPLVSVIDEIGQTLSRILDRVDWDIPQYLKEEIGTLQKPKITFESPKDIQKRTDPENLICIYLYRISENPYLKNHEREQYEDTGDSYSPLYLDLHYLIAPFCKSKREEILILGTIIQSFANHASLTESLLYGNLKDTDYVIHLLFDSLTLDELTKIWSAFQTTGYHPSLSYLVTPVPIDISMETTFQRVVSQQMQYFYGNLDDEASL